VNGRVVEMVDAGVLLGGRPVLRGIDLSVAAGEVVAVLGANGSGKSTLVRSMLGLVPLRRGSVRLFETPLDTFRAWQRVGFVPQRTSATAGVPASVGEVVASGRLSRRRAWQRATSADRRAVTEAIGAVGLEDRTTESVATLSGGQQQRVLIARALAGEPELLVLDEPTAGIDLPSQDLLADVLARLVGAGTTIVLVAHELGPLAPLVGRTVVMRDGRVAYDGDPLPSFEHVGHDPHHAFPDPGAAPGTHRPDLVTPIDRVTEERGR
jgi:zinc transport system ATP-binding protein